jgi:hypothetical protein
VVWQCWWMLVGCFDMGYMSHIWRLHLEEQWWFWQGRSISIGATSMTSYYYCS